MKISIRKGTQKDIAAALELVRELAHYEKCLHEVSVSEEQMTKWGFGTDKVFYFYVAENEEKIIGLALYYYKYSTWKGKCIFLEDIIVTETLRGKGVGKKLFETVAQTAKEEKVKRMEWQVLDWNKPAINFYEKYHARFDDEWINCKLTDEDLANMKFENL